MQLKARQPVAWFTALTRQVDFSEGVPGCGPCCCQQVNRLIVDMVAVTQVKIGQQRHLPTDEA